MASLCRIHRQQGHTLAIHCIFRKGALGEQLESEGFPVIVHGQGHRIPTMASLYRALRSERWDVGHCHNVIATVWGAPMLRAAGVGTVITTRHSLVRPPYRRREEAQYSLASRLCARVVGVCRATSENLSNAPLADRARISTIYNGAAPPAASGSGEPHPNGKFTFVTVARLALPKDHDTLLRAFAKARQTAPEIALWIVGDGERRAALEKLSAELMLGQSLTFWGERHNPGDFLRHANVFVLSSLSEGVPMSLLEAMSAGLPAIVSDVGGMAEVARQADAGPVVPCGNVPELAAAMRSCASAPDGMRSIGARVQAYYRCHFTLEIMAESYFQLYSTAASQNGRATLS